jgi:hypothetical protein
MATGGSRLPQHLIERALMHGGELAWALDDIPAVIEAARDANLVSVGGQLQFRFPDGGTCECCWVEVDIYKSVSTSASWQERVDRAAAAAMAEFLQLSTKLDFLAEGRNAFPAAFADLERQGQDAALAMCFVWYVEAEKESRTAFQASEHQENDPEYWG